MCKVFAHSAKVAECALIWKTQQSDIALRL